MLYTKKGDGGTTKLFDSSKGERISKTASIFEALGTIDELNSALGYAKSLAQENEKFIAGNLEKIQGKLFIIQAEIAGADKYLKKEDVAFLEDLIAQIELSLSEINSFIIPGGTPLGAFLDFTRAIGRRAERKTLSLKEKGEREIKNESLIFLNRLSSALYALARLANKNGNITEYGPKYE
ncbi:ATP:cob(I)alamin adenosyltransferase [Candidatus Nomurabacteria bacterium RIFCSPLOWO2_01_FULL_41_21]|uniref:Corrinoid adenosyltransferase n=1 Tax=Candidatus Nomurabacteria bacterium RIFCSPLOWO2_01_FULL_41_21 TaxID=1801776 RepID=A0A1F6X363_9BACT|nr:MAG: ATP:cob(I)alamin adenosyltransferase [Candidatus Nomurabacteria bacterium RIFCSPLOWO2_01_FULL_41_21]